MRKRFLAALLAALMLTSLSACGKADNKDSSSVEDAGALFTDEEQMNIETAKNVVTDWFGYMNSANYTEACKLMSADYASQMGYDDIPDGESAGQFDFEFIEDGTMLSTDDSGNIIVCVGVYMSPVGSTYEKYERIYYVTCSESGALITSSSGGEAVGGEGVDRGALASELAETAFEAANGSITSDIDDGEYTESDSNAVVDAVWNALSDRASGYELTFVIRIEDGAAVHAEITISNSGGGFTASYPSANA